jgi:hypothetical protein
MLIGCCHCGETPSESTPPSESSNPPSESLPPSESVSSDSYSDVTNSCIEDWGCAAIPRRLKVTISFDYSYINQYCHCAMFAGTFFLNYHNCYYIPASGFLGSHIKLVYLTAERAPVFSSLALNECYIPGGNSFYTGEGPALGEPSLPAGVDQGFRLALEGYSIGGSVFQPFPYWNLRSGTIRSKLLPAFQAWNGRLGFRLRAGNKCLWEPMDMSITTPLPLDAGATNAFGCQGMEYNVNSFVEPA